MTCVAFQAIREYIVGKTAPVPVKIYDYYEPGVHDEYFKHCFFFFAAIFSFIWQCRNGDDMRQRSQGRNRLARDVTVIWNVPSPTKLGDGFFLVEMGYFSLKFMT